MFLTETDEEKDPLLGNSSEEEVENELDEDLSEDFDTVTNIPQQSIGISKPKLSHFATGARLVSDIIFPIAFWGLLFRDINEFRAHPNNRYGNTLIKILLGLSSNAQTYTTQLNINLTQNPLWQVSLGLPLAMIVMGGMHYGLNTNNDYDGEHISYGMIHDLFAPLWPRSRFNQYLNRLEDEISQGPTSELDSGDLADFLVDFNHRSGLAKFYASGFLAKYIRHREQSESYIQINADEFDNNTVGLYRYHIWKEGLTKNKLYNVFYLRHFFRYYPQLLMVIMGIKGAMNTAHDFKMQSQCENSGDMYRYANQFHLNDCVVCDWHILPNAKSQQSCVTSAIQYSDSAHQIQTRLNQLHPGSPISVIDFSNKNLNQWTDLELDQIFTSLERVVVLPVDRLDLSNIHQLDVPISDYKIERLGQFIERIQVKDIDLTNQGLGDAKLTSMLERFSSESLKGLELTGNNLSDNIVDFLAKKMIAGDLVLERLQLCNNLITGSGLAQIGEYSNTVNSTLIDVNLSSNPIQSSLLTRFFTTIQSSNTLESLDFSDIALSTASLEAFAQAAVRTNNSYNINLAGTRLSFAHMEHFKDCMPFMRTLNISNNLLAERDVNLLLGQAQQGRLQGLDVSNNNILRLELVVRHLPNTVIHLDLSGNSAENTNFNLTFSMLGSSRVEELGLANVEINPAMLHSFAEIFSNRSTPLSLDISHSRLTFEGLEPILSIPALHNINLSGNLLNDTSIPALSSAFINNENLFNANIGGNTFNTTSVEHIASILSQTHLKKLNMNGLVTSKAEGVSLFKALVKPTPHIQNLGDENIGRDEARALYRDLPSTEINELSLRGITLSHEVESAYLRTLPAARFSSPGLFLPNETRQNQLSIPTSHAVLLTASGLGIAIGLFLAILLVHRIYTYLTDKRVTPTARQGSNNNV